MATKPTRPTPRTSVVLESLKVGELVEEHGSLVEELLTSGRLPASQVDNFYGRHADRRNAILDSMRAGASYSSAYRSSKDCFDTKRWGKLGVRAAACRGHLLKTASRLVQRDSQHAWNQEQIESWKEMARQLGKEACELVSRMVQYEMRIVSPARSKTGPSPLSLPDSTVTAGEVERNLTTALTKMRKNTRDAPLMLTKLGELPSVAEVSKVAVESARIVNGVPLLLSLLEAGSSIPAIDGGDPDKDRFGVGVEYACWLDRAHPPDHPIKRIAAAQRPDVDELVATWLVDRFVYPADRCVIEFVPRESTPAPDSFDAVVAAGQVHDPERLLFGQPSTTLGAKRSWPATRSVWGHVSETGLATDGLSELVEQILADDPLVQSPPIDSVTVRSAIGLHMIAEAAERYAQSDQLFYQGIGVWLDALLG